MVHYLLFIIYLVIINIYYFKYYSSVLKAQSILNYLRFAFCFLLRDEYSRVIKNVIKASFEGLRQMHETLRLISSRNLGDKWHVVVVIVFFRGIFVDLFCQKIYG